jgi:thioredoxin reductase (NADPH)
VFTPLEIGTVGYTEQEAIDEFGEDGRVDCYTSLYKPLEWELNKDRDEEIVCMAKIVVLRERPLREGEEDTFDSRVLGIHIAAPNAGEIIQGFGVALRKGNLTHRVSMKFHTHSYCE